MPELGSYSGKSITSGTPKAPTLSIDYSNLTQNKHNTNLNNNINSRTSVEADLSEFLEEFEETNTENVNNMQFATGAVEGSLGLTETELEVEKPWYEKVWDSVKETAATVAVATTSVVSGIADIAEGLVDGVAWTGGKLVEGASWLVGETAGIFSEEAKANVMSWREDFKKDTRDFIATDWVGEANKAFYENTSLGQAINETSALKYDSKTAQGIRNVSKAVGEIAIATGLTIITGGAATPFVCGTMVGLGNSSETLYQNNPESSTLTELMIFGTGALNGVAWFANGKLGASFVTEFGKSLGEIGLKDTATRLAETFTKPEFLKNWMKRSLTDAGNYISSAMMSADDVIGFVTGEKEVNAENIALLGLGFLANFGLNTLEDGVRLCLGGYRAPSTEEAINAMKGYSSDTPQQDVDLEKTEEVKEITETSDLSKTQSDNIIDNEPVKANEIADPDLPVSEHENLADQPRVEQPTSSELSSELEKTTTAIPESIPSLSRDYEAAKEYLDNIEDFQAHGITLEDYLKDRGIDITKISSRAGVGTLFGTPAPQLYDLTNGILKDKFGLSQSLVNKLSKAATNAWQNNSTEGAFHKEFYEILKYAKKSQSELDEIWSIVQNLPKCNSDIDILSYSNLIIKYLSDDDAAKLTKLMDDYNNGYVSRLIANATPAQKDMVKIYTESMTGCSLVKASSPGVQASEEQMRKLYSDIMGSSDLYDSTKPYEEQINELYTRLFKDTFGDSVVYDPTVHNASQLNDLINNNRIGETITVSRMATDFNGFKKLKDLKVGMELQNDTFLSTTSSVEDINNFFADTSSNGKIRIDIIVPANSKAAYVEPLSGVTTYYQNEIIIGAGTKLTIIAPPKQEKMNGKQLVTVVQCLLTGGE